MHMLCNTKKENSRHDGNYSKSFEIRALFDVASVTVNEYSCRNI